MSPDMIAPVAPLYQWLFGLGLLLLVIWLLNRAFPTKPQDTDTEARRAFQERLARELTGRDV